MRHDQFDSAIGLYQDICTYICIYGRKRFLIPVTYFSTNQVNPLTTSNGYNPKNCGKNRSQKNIPLFAYSHISPKYE